MSTYRLESISIFDLKSADLREEAIAEIENETYIAHRRASWGLLSEETIAEMQNEAYPKAYRIHLESGQVLEAVHYTALNLVVFDHDVYDAKTIHEAIPQALADLEPDSWSLEK